MQALNTGTNDVLPPALGVTSPKEDSNSGALEHLKGIGTK